MAEFLTHEQELILSDALVARRALRDRLEREHGGKMVEYHQPLITDPEDKRVWEEGFAAANRLVEAYMPHNYSLARGVLGRKSLSSGAAWLSIEDLIQVGAEAMMASTWAFDARGKSRTDPNGRRGVRFAEYSRMNVLKVMNRYAAKQSTTMAVNVDVILETSNYLAVRAELEAELGRKPTDEEIERRSQVSTHYVEQHLSYRSGMANVDDVEVGDASTIEEYVQALMDAQKFNGILDEMLRKYIADELVDIFMAFIGADSGVPRDASEVAKMFGRRRGDIADVEQQIYSVIRHPQNRVVFYQYLKKLQEAGVQL